MGPDVQIDSVVLACATAIEVETCVLTSPNTEVRLESFHVGLFPFGKPSALFGRIRKGGKDTLRRSLIAAFDRECVVAYRLFEHLFS